MNIGAKFNLVLAGLLLIGFVIAGALSYRILHQNAREDVTQQARTMMEAAQAMRRYTIEQVRPHIQPKADGEFVSQTVPAYAATQGFSYLRETFPDYVYKEAALNPTNLKNRAVDWEADIVEHFRNNPDATEVVNRRSTATGESLYLAHPIRVGNKACLTCHSTPEAAPKAMLAKYGSKNGFGWKHNEIVGAQIVSVPLSVPIQQANQAFMVFMGSIAAVFVALLVALNLLLGRLVIKPIKTMAETANRVSLGEKNIPEFDKTSNDEIGTLAAAFTRMRRSLEKAMKMLGS